MNPIVILYQNAVRLTLMKWTDEINNYRKLDSNIDSIERFLPKGRIVILHRNKKESMRRLDHYERWMDWLGVADMTQENSHAR